MAVLRIHIIAGHLPRHGGWPSRRLVMDDAQTGEAHFAAAQLHAVARLHNGGDVRHLLAVDLQPALLGDPAGVAVAIDQPGIQEQRGDPARLIACDRDLWPLLVAERAAPLVQLLEEALAFLRALDAVI